MPLLYSAEITASNKTLTVPFGVKRCKMRSNAQTPIIVLVEELGGTHDPDYFTRRGSDNQ